MRTIRILVILALFALAAFGQGAAVNQVSGPPPGPIQGLYYYDGSSNLQYICYSPEVAAPTTQKRVDSTLTSIGVATNVGTVTTASAHGLYIGARVTITGATVQTGLNATYVVKTTASATTYTIATVGVADGTYTESTLVVTTTFPLATSPKWAIMVLVYNGSNLLTSNGWAAQSTGYSLACTNRTNY